MKGELLMFFIFYKHLSKRGNVRMTVLSYPDNSAISYESYKEAEKAGEELLKSGVGGAIWFEVRRIY
tara:strand:- start:347 stop:547 length:201 start_codon:yes stop_codon:yes gene_type:complete